MAIDSLLQFIKDKESYGGNYNLMARDKASVDRGLTKKTIKQVLQEQAKNNNRAAGAYQIIPSTMKLLMKRMKLTGDEVFDEKMQDAMAMELLRHRGLDKVTAGQMTPEDFGNSLAKEWASLPLVTDIKNKKAGTSYYQGKSGNVALVSEKEMPVYMGTLSALAAPQPAPAPAPEPQYATMEDLLAAKGVMPQFESLGNPLYTNELMVAP